MWPNEMVWTHDKFDFQFKDEAGAMSSFKTTNLKTERLK